MTAVAQLDDGTLKTGEWLLSQNTQRRQSQWSTVLHTRLVTLVLWLVGTAAVGLAFALGAWHSHCLLFTVYCLLLVTATYFYSLLLFTATYYFRDSVDANSNPSGTAVPSSVEVEPGAFGCIILCWLR